MTGKEVQKALMVQGGYWEDESTPVCPLLTAGMLAHGQAEGVRCLKDACCFWDIEEPDEAERNCCIGSISLSAGVGMEYLGGIGKMLNRRL